MPFCCGSLDCIVNYSVILLFNYNTFFSMAPKIALYRIRKCIFWERKQLTGSTVYLYYLIEISESVGMSSRAG